MNNKTVTIIKYLFYIQYFAFFIVVSIWHNDFLKIGLMPMVVESLLCIIYEIYYYKFYLATPLAKYEKSLLFFLLFGLAVILLSFLSFYTPDGLGLSYKYILRHSYFIPIGVFIGLPLYRCINIIKNDLTDIFARRKEWLCILMLMGTLQLWEPFMYTSVFNIVYLILVILIVAAFCSRFYALVYFSVLSFFFLQYSSGSTVGILLILTGLFLVLQPSLSTIIFSTIGVSIIGFVLFLLGIRYPDFVFNHDPNTWWRLEYWKYAIKKVFNLNNSGFGFGTPYFDHFLSNKLGIGFDQADPNLNLYVIAQHNSFINIFYRGGPFFLLLILIINYNLLILPLKIVKRNPSLDTNEINTLKILLVCFIFVNITISINCGLESPAYFFQYLFFVVVYLGYVKNLDIGGANGS